MIYSKNKIFYLLHIAIISIWTLFFVTIFNLFKFTPVYAQDKCQTTLLEAKQLYDKGYFYEVIELLIPCLTNGLSKPEKVRAFRLMALAHIAEDDFDRARDDIEELLYLNYNYEPDPVEDPKLYRELVNEVKTQLMLIEPERHLIMLAPIDFRPLKKGQKWSNKFVNNLHKFISKCPVIESIRKECYLKDLEKLSNKPIRDSLYYVRFQSQNYFYLSGNGQKKGEVFVLDVSLKRFPKGRIVWRDSVMAHNEHNLADSVGIRVVEFFGYKTRFVGVEIPTKKYALYSSILCIPPTVLHLFAVKEKTKYKNVITSEDAIKNFSKLRTYEELRNSFGILTSFFIVGFPYYYTKIIKRPIFEKIKRK